MPTFPLVTSWTGTAGDGDWSNPANWSNGVPPDPATLTFDEQDRALIDATSQTITIAGSDVLRLDVSNAATGIADLLGGTFTVSGNATDAFTNTGLTFTGLAAGAEATQSVSLSTSTAGVFSETLTLDATGSNASGYAVSVGCHAPCRPIVTQGPVLEQARTMAYPSVVSDGLIIRRHATVA